MHLVTSVGCTPCLRVKRVLSELCAEIPDLKIEEVEFSSPQGAKLAIQNNILYPPAVLVDNMLIANGKVDADQMITAIRRIDGEHNS